MHDAALHERMKIMVGKTTYKALGEATNHNPETVRRYMAGQAPSVEFLTAFVNAYSVNADWLLTGRGPMDRSEVCAEALAKADPNELMSAIARRIEEMCDRIERIECFLNAMDSHFSAPDISIRHEQGDGMQIAKVESGRKRMTKQHANDA